MATADRNLSVRAVPHKLPTVKKLDVISKRLRGQRGYSTKPVPGQVPLDEPAPDVTS